MDEELVESQGGHEHFFLAKGYRYRKQTPHFDDQHNTDEWQDSVYSYAKQVALAKNHEIIWDLGCGAGYKLNKYFANYRTIGFELDQNLDFLRDNYPNKTWLPASEFASLDKHADLCICSDVIEHVSDPHEFLYSLKHSDVSQFLISTPAREVLFADELRTFKGPPNNKFHYFEWTMGEFNALISVYFNIEKHLMFYNHEYSQIVLTGSPKR